METTDYDFPTHTEKCRVIYMKYYSVFEPYIAE